MAYCKLPDCRVETTDRFGDSLSLKIHQRGKWAYLCVRIDSSHSTRGGRCKNHVMMNSMKLRQFLGAALHRLNWNNPEEPRP